MSISDLIIVMKDGVVQQIGKPQEVYDSPANLFVAKFLGTPPINVFDGRIRDGRLWIGGDAVLDLKGVMDQEVYVGIRPEGFVLNDKGALGCTLRGVEVMGRDISVVSVNDAAAGPAVRSIVGAEDRLTQEARHKPEGSPIRFDVLPRKVFLFDRRTEEKIDYEVRQRRNGD